MANSPEHGLLQEGWISSAGTSLSHAEIEALVAERFPRKAYCTVEDWLIFHVDEPAESLARVRATGLEPMFMYAHCVIYDGHGRFPLRRVGALDPMQIIRWRLPVRDAKHDLCAGGSGTRDEGLAEDNIRLMLIAGALSGPASNEIHDVQD